VRAEMQRALEREVRSLHDVFLARIERQGKEYAAVSLCGRRYRR
jgi:hypothetical protein